MPVTTEPLAKLILPSSPEESSAPSNMPPAKQIAKWQENVEKKVKFKLKDTKGGHIIGSDAAKLCEYAVDHLFPEHNTIKNTVNYRYNVVMLIEWPKDMRTQPLPTFFMDVSQFHDNFIPA